jgi:MarR family transcriptional regulator, organic hydroperoxide resistance regulator
MNFSFERPEKSPGFLLWQLTNQWQRQQRQALSKVGVTHPQFVVLAGLFWLNSLSDNTVTQQQVSEFTQIDKMSLSDLIMTLLRKKMLNRSPHQYDKRAYSLRLTKKGGRQIVLKALPVVEGIDALFFSQKNASLLQLLHILKHLSALV